MNIFVLWFQFHWSLFLRVQLTIDQATRHYLNQCWPSWPTHICGTGREGGALIEICYRGGGGGGGGGGVRWLKFVVAVAFTIALIKSQVLWAKLRMLSLIRYPAIQLARACNPDKVFNGIFPLVNIYYTRIFIYFLLDFGWSHWCLLD